MLLWILNVIFYILKNIEKYFSYIFCLMFFLFLCKLKFCLKIIVGVGNVCKEEVFIVSWLFFDYFVYMEFLLLEFVKVKLLVL